MFSPVKQDGKRNKGKTNITNELQTTALKRATTQDYRK